MTLGFLASMLNPDVTVFVQQGARKVLLSTAAELVSRSEDVLDWRFFGNALLINVKGENND